MFIGEAQFRANVDCIRPFRTSASLGFLFFSFLSCSQPSKDRRPSDCSLHLVLKILSVHIILSFLPPCSSAAFGLLAYASLALSHQPLQYSLILFSPHCLGTSIGQRGRTSQSDLSIDHRFFAFLEYRRFWGIWHLAVWKVGTVFGNSGVPPSGDSELNIPVQPAHPHHIVDSYQTHLGVQFSRTH